MYLSRYLRVLSSDAQAPEDFVRESATVRKVVLESLTPEEADNLDRKGFIGDTVAQRIAEATGLSRPACRNALEAFIVWRDREIKYKEAGTEARESFHFDQFTRDLETRMGRRTVDAFVPVNTVGLTCSQRQAIEDFIRERFSKEERQWIVIDI